MRMFACGGKPLDIERKRSGDGRRDRPQSSLPAGELFRQMAAKRIGFWRWAAHWDDFEIRASESRGAMER